MSKLYSEIVPLVLLIHTAMIPALREVAANDPSPEVEGHSIRKSAAEAIAEIQKRAGKQP
jgi:hypothetical protein